MTAYHPAGDGLVERLNQTIEKLLSLCVQRPRQLGYALAKSADGLSLCRSVVDHIHTALPHVLTRHAPPDRRGLRSTH